MHRSSGWTRITTRILLNSAVSDDTDDVRRATVMTLGFVLFRHPKILPPIVASLAESCHAHLRDVAAIAIGVACVKTGSMVAVVILNMLTSDAVRIVRQGDLTEMSMVLMHHT